MTCEKSPKTTQNNTISREEAIALYNAIDLQLLKEAPIAQSDAMQLVRQTEKPLDILPKKDLALKALDAMNDKVFAKMLLYSFIPDGAPALEQLPVVAEKRNEHIALIDFVSENTNVDRGYLQKHLRNVLVKGYGKSPENILHDVATGKDKSLKGLGWILAAIDAASSLATLFSGPNDDWGKNGIDVSTPQGYAVSLIPDWHKAADILFQYPAFKTIAPFLEKNARKGQADQIGTLIFQTDPNLFAKIGIPTTALSFLQPTQRALQNTPATQDWAGAKLPPNQNLTQDPSYTPTKSKDNTAWWLLGGVAVVGVGSYVLLSD